MVGMKNALLKDTFREIRQTFSRFLSIFAIVALGVSFFAGIKAACPDMKITADKYFDDYNLMDIRLVSTIGFNDYDVKAVKKTAGVKGVFPAYSIDTLAKIRGKDMVLKVISLPMDKVYNPDESYINRVKLVSGRLPQKPDECVTEKGKMGNSGLSIGSKIKLSSGTDKSIGQSLKVSEFTIVGIIETPYYISYERESSSIGSGKVSSFIMVPQKDFNIPAYTDIFVTVKNAMEEGCYDESYDDIIEPVKKALEDTGENRVQVRYDEIVSYANKELDIKKGELSDAQAKMYNEFGDAAIKLQDSDIQVSSGGMELQSKENEFSNTIRDTEASINDGYRKLEDGENKYNQELQQFNNAKAQAEAEFSDADKKINDAQRDIDTKKGELDKLKTYLSLMYYNLSEAEKLTLKTTFEVGGQQLSDAEQQLEMSRAELKTKKKELENAEAELNTAGETLKNTRKQLVEQEKSFESAKENVLSQFVENGKKLFNSKMELGNGQRDIESGKKEFDIKISEAQMKIAYGEGQIDDIEKPEWFVLGRDTNPGFVEYGNSADSMDAIAQVFPAFFFLIAALVCLTTMARMIDEQRIYIGTLKALGYNKVSIARKYLLYASLASLSGSVFGIVLGFKLFPTVIFNAYGLMFTLPPVITEFNIFYAALSTAFAVLTTTIAAFFACYKELMMTPATLMRPKAPKAGNRIFLERIKFLWQRFSFIQKITARNMLRYKKRFFMTVFGIGGCTALLMAGFGIKDSIMSAAAKQYGELCQYDMSISLKESVRLGEPLSFRNIMARDNRVSSYILINEQNIDIGSGNNKESVTLIVPEGTKKLENFIIFRIRTTGQKVPLTEEGAVLTEKLAKNLKVGIGDKVYIIDDDDKRIDVKVTGITENYLSHYVYMSPGLYNKAYGENIKYQKLLVKTTDTSEDFQNKLSLDLLEDGGASAVSFTTSIKKTFSDIVDSLNNAVLVLIVSAGALAFVVLYNLTNINVTERLREIATIKVLGFYDNEVSAYVYRENIVLTLVGIISGLILGIFLHRFIMTTVEVNNLMFGRQIKPLSYVYSSLLTAVFSAGVNFVMYFKLKKIGMVESLKSVD